MTRKDYILVGKVLYRARQLVLNSEESCSKNTIDWLTERLCVAFQGDNSNFNADKFKALVQKEDKVIAIT